MNMREFIGVRMSRGRVVRVRSALTPFLWLFPWSLAFLGFAVAFREDTVIKYFLLCLAAVPMFVTISVGCYFAVANPDKLRSEEYRLRRRPLHRKAPAGAAANENPHAGLETEQENRPKDA